MGYYAITNLINRKDNMSKETIRETVNTIKSADGMKAVKVAFELSESVQDSVSKVMQVVSMLDKNMNLMATKVLELEEKQKKTIEELSKYERSKN